MEEQSLMGREPRVYANGSHTGSASGCNLKTLKVWIENTAISEWLRKCRMGVFGSALAALDPDDIKQMAVMERIKHATAEASKNTTHLLDRRN